MFIILSVLVLISLAAAFLGWRNYQLNQQVQTLKLENEQADAAAFRAQHYLSIADRRADKAEERLADAIICMEMLSADGHLETTDILGKRKPCPEMAARTITADTIATGRLALPEPSTMQEAWERDHLRTVTPRVLETI